MSLPISPHTHTHTRAHARKHAGNARTQLVGLLWTGDRPVRKGLCLHNTKHSQETSIHVPARFEPAIPASEMPQIHALDRPTTGIGVRKDFSFYRTNSWRLIQNVILLVTKQCKMVGRSNFADVFRAREQ
jgi:hypothetical protein